MIATFPLLPHNIYCFLFWVHPPHQQMMIEKKQHEVEREMCWGLQEELEGGSLVDTTQMHCAQV